jgi:carbon storage regulator CsrA
MLILSRKRGEGVRLDGPGKVVVLGVKGELVKFGVIAGPSVKILRDELTDFDEPEPGDNPHSSAA